MVMEEMEETCKWSKKRLALSVVAAVAVCAAVAGTTAVLVTANRESVEQQTDYAPPPPVQIGFKGDWDIIVNRPARLLFEEEFGDFFFANCFPVGKNTQDFICTDTRPHLAKCTIVHTPVYPKELPIKCEKFVVATPWNDWFGIQHATASLDGKFLYVQTSDTFAKISLEDGQASVLASKTRAAAFDERQFFRCVVREKSFQQSVELELSCEDNNGLRGIANVQGMDNVAVGLMIDPNGLIWMKVHDRMLIFERDTVTGMIRLISEGTGRVVSSSNEPVDLFYGQSDDVGRVLVFEVVCNHIGAWEWRQSTDNKLQLAQEVLNEYPGCYFHRTRTQRHFARNNSIWYFTGDQVKLATFSLDTNEFVTRQVHDLWAESDFRTIFPLANGAFAVNCYDVMEFTDSVFKMNLYQDEAESPIFWYLHPDGQHLISVMRASGARDVGLLRVFSRDTLELLNVRPFSQEAVDPDRFELGVFSSSGDSFFSVERSSAQRFTWRLNKWEDHLVPDDMRPSRHISGYLDVGVTTNIHDGIGCFFLDVTSVRCFVAIKNTLVVTKALWQSNLDFPLGSAPPEGDSVLETVFPFDTSDMVIGRVRQEDNFFGVVAWEQAEQRLVVKVFDPYSLDLKVDVNKTIDSSFQLHRTTDVFFTSSFVVISQASFEKTFRVVSLVSDSVEEVGLVVDDRWFSRTKVVSGPVPNSFVLFGERGGSGIEDLIFMFEVRFGNDGAMTVDRRVLSPMVEENLRLHGKKMLFEPDGSLVTVAQNTSIIYPNTAIVKLRLPEFDSFAPTMAPTHFPTTAFPTRFPTNAPTQFPTRFPTNAPTQFPSPAPTLTMEPPALPTSSPTSTREPTSFPTSSPTSTMEPTRFPTWSPSTKPTKTPTGSPTKPFVDDDSTLPVALGAGGAAFVFLCLVVFMAVRWRRRSRALSVTTFAIPVDVSVQNPSYASDEK